MSARQDKPHYAGHRARLRDRFRQTGFKGFRDYEALELLLCYAVPRRDVKPLAKSLIEKFGGVEEVLDADFESLAATEGLTESSATFIIALREFSSLYLRKRIRKKKDIISHTAELLEYCRMSMGSLAVEQFRAIFLNSQNEVIADEVIHEGTVNQAVIYPRTVMERALARKATAMIFVHNHPGGSAKPSRQDEAITAELARVARGLGISVFDHLIITRTGHYSFRDRGFFDKLPR